MTLETRLFLGGFVLFCFSHGHEQRRMRKFGTHMAEEERKWKIFVCRVRGRHRSVEARSIQKGNPSDKS